jgi:Fe-S-cluster containining protein
MPICVKKDFGFSFDPDACGKCPGHCCRGKSGKVWLGGRDVREISRILGLNVINFLDQYADRVNNRLSLKERFARGGYQCILYDEQIRGCSVYEVRPDQCRRFPFWEYFKEHGAEVAGECPGIRMMNSAGCQED